MKTANEVERLCNGLVSNFSTELLKIAAEKQLATSTIASANKSDAECEALICVMTKLINKRTLAAGFTLLELDKATRAIELAGEALRHLAIIHEPISNVATSSAAAVLNKVMYPCDQKPENCPYGPDLEPCTKRPVVNQMSPCGKVRNFAHRQLKSSLSFKLQVLVATICANYSVRIFTVLFSSEFLM
jgi:hypothetical protein